MTDTKTFKDIDKGIQKLVDDTKKNFKLTKSWQDKLEIHAVDVLEKTENDRKPRAKVQKEMLRVLVTQQSQDKVRARDKTAADYKMGKATLDQLKAARLTKEDLVNSGFGGIGSNIELMRQGWQETVGKFTGAIKGYWSYLKENSAVLRAAQKFWQSTAVQKFKDIGNQIASTVGTHLREVLGEFQEVFDIMQNVFGAVKSAVTGIFTGLFNEMREKGKIRREQRMVQHLKKIQDGIGFLVKGEKRDAITGGAKKGKGMIDKLLSLLGLGGIGLTLAAAFIKGAVLTFLAAALIKPFKDAFMAWRDGKGGTEASAIFLRGITKIPRMIIGWLAGMFGADKLKAAMSDDSFDDFVVRMNEGITRFLDTIIDWFSNTWTAIINAFKTAGNNVLDMIPFGMGDKYKMSIGTSESVSKAKAKITPMDQISNTGKSKNDIERIYSEEIAKRKTLYNEAEAAHRETGTKELAKIMQESVREQKELKEAMLKAITEAPAYVNSQHHNYMGYGAEGQKFPDAESGTLKNNNLNWQR